MKTGTIITQRSIHQERGPDVSLRKSPDNLPCTVLRLHQYLALVIGIVIICINISPVLALNNTTIQCGVILPLSGELGQSGQELLQGIELAADEINTKSGSGYQIELDVRDDAGDVNTALMHFKEMQTSGVPVVIGSFATDVTLPLAETTKNFRETILVAPHANGMALSGISPAFYQLNAPVFYLGRFVSDWVSYTAERVAIVYIDTDYGRSLRDEILSDLANGTVHITGTEPVFPDTDFGALIQKILDGGPDTVVVGVYDSRVEDILKNLDDAGYRGQVVLTEAGGMRDLESNATDSLSKFSICTISASTSLVPGAHTDRFLEAYQEKYSQNPSEGYAGYGYDAMIIIYDAIQLGPNTDTVSAQSLQEGLNTIRYYGVTGPKVFDDKNAVSPAMDRWVYRNGKFELMSTSV